MSFKSQIIKMHIGIDYGAKFAGTTAVCFEENGKLYLRQSEKKKDADSFLEKLILEKQPDSVFIDAPLSLPNAYLGKGEDYFYRKCDRAVGGMSPMFLGGLTARAMKLKSQSETPERPFYEIYPAQLVRVLFPDFKKQKSKESLSEFLKIINTHLPIPLLETPQNWHQADAVLAWLSGWRFKQGISVTYGDSDEGLIIV